MEEKLQFSSPSTVPMQRKCESILFFSLVVYVFFFFRKLFILLSYAVYCHVLTMWQGFCLSEFCCLLFSVNKEG